MPESWALGDNLPIYKNKGNKSLPKHYRPITLLSCLGKLFTSIINIRINNFVEKYEVISSSQSGFRKGNLFVIQSLMEMSKSSSKKLFCSFSDFQQAFDNVWRDGLWSKLTNYMVNGKCLNFIKRHV